MSRIAVAERKAKAAAPAATETIGTLTDRLFALRADKAALNEKIKEVEALYTQAEQLLLEKLKAEGTTRGAGKKATCSVSTTEVPNITDWDKVIAYIKKSGHYHLIQRRLTAESWRELYASKGAIPGTEAFNKVTVSIRGL